MENVVFLNQCFLLGNREYLVFIRVEFHLPFFFPCHKFIQIVWRVLFCDVTVRYAIVSSANSLTVDLISSGMSLI